MNVKAEHEDKIYPIREFIHRLGDVQEEQFERLWSELVADGMEGDEITKDWLFDYCFNSDPEEDQVTFEEFCDKEYMRKYRREKK